MLTETKFKKKS